MTALSAEDVVAEETSAEEDPTDVGGLVTEGEVAVPVLPPAETQM